jgi:hypothetical protein
MQITDDMLDKIVELAKEVAQREARFDRMLQERDRLVLERDGLKVDVDVARRNAEQCAASIQVHNNIAKVREETLKKIWSAR